jgi:photosystem II stability/assembly factor-like uncharacterized protein
MSRLRLWFSVIIIIFLAGKLSAQQTLDVKSEFGGRHAKIPQSPADTGILFDEYRLEKAAQDYWNAARFSGDNAGKTMQQIETESYNAVRNMQNLAAFKTLSNPAWQPIAGSQDGHASGRVRGIAFDPTDSKIVYIAAASGGIWKTMDITGQPIQWINLSDRLSTVNFGSIATDQKRPGVIYAGTGESQGDGYMNLYGDGVFKSTDGGMNWTTVLTTTQEGSYCSQIAIDPINTDTVYIATGNTWIMRSMDGGTTWQKITVGVAALSIAIDPVNTNNLYTSGFGSIYRSTNNGTSWTRCVTGLPGGDRITVAIAPSAPNTVYASIGTGSSGTVPFPSLGIWVSDDYGVTWRKQYQYNATLPDGPKNKDPLGQQEEWCNSIVVHPSNPATIFVGGLDIYQSNDSGKDLTQRTHWNDTKTAGDYVHADIHFLTFNGNTLYACTDGGIASSPSFTVWNTTLNKGIATLQFVGVDANREFTYVTGGCQDNSTNRAWINSPEFHETIGGDGGHAWVSQEQGNIAYTTYVYANFKQSLDSAWTWSDNLIQAGVGPTTENGPTYTPFYTVYDCSSDGSVIALGGNSHVWVSTSGGQDGFPLKSNLSIGNSYAIHVAPADPSGSTIWAASGGTLFRTIDQGITWTKGASLPGAGTITGITSNPNDASQVFVCSSGGKYYWKSSDSGKSFTSPATNFPASPAWSIARNPDNAFLFVGHEKGVVWSGDGGVTWNPLMNGMPNVIVTQLRVRGANNDKLLAGTYGRGMFWLDISALAGVSADATLPLSLDPAYPNPMTTANATIGFSLKDPGLTTITLHDLLGRELRILEKSYYNAGKYSISFAKENISAGTYFVMLTSNGKSVSEKIIIE